MVGRVLYELLKCVELGFIHGGTPLFSRAKDIVNRLSNLDVKLSGCHNGDDFIKLKSSISNLLHGSDLVPILMARLGEAFLCSSVAPLASVILSGSILEGIILSLANLYPFKFNKAKSAP